MLICITEQRKVLQSSNKSHDETRRTTIKYNRHNVASDSAVDSFRLTLFLHGVCMFRECAHEQHVRRTLTLTLTHTITAYSVSGNVVRVRILICATRQKPCRKRVYHSVHGMSDTQHNTLLTPPPGGAADWRCT